MCCGAIALGRPAASTWIRRATAASRGEVAPPEIDDSAATARNAGSGRDLRARRLGFAPLRHGDERSNCASGSDDRGEAGEAARLPPKGGGYCCVQRAAGASRQPARTPRLRAVRGLNTRPAHGPLILRISDQGRACQRFLDAFHVGNPLVLGWKGGWLQHQTVQAMRLGGAARAILPGSTGFVHFPSMPYSI
jgi:hypothetical protein